MIRGISLPKVAWLALSALSTFLAGCEFYPPAIYVLPAHPPPIMYIVYDQPDGTPREFQGLSRVYRIPPSGVLCTQFTHRNGWILKQRAYIVSISDTNQLPVNFYSLGKRSNDVAFFVGGTRRIPKEVSANKWVDDGYATEMYYCLYRDYDSLINGSRFDTIPSCRN